MFLEPWNLLDEILILICICTLAPVEHLYIILIICLILVIYSALSVFVPLPKAHFLLISQFQEACGRADMFIHMNMYMCIYFYILMNKII